MVLVFTAMGNLDGLVCSYQDCGPSLRSDRGHETITARRGVSGKGDKVGTTTNPAAPGAPVNITDVLPATAGNPPTVAGVFGAASPWLANPTGTGPVVGGIITFNPQYFATPQTAALVAGWVSGTVTTDTSFCGPASNPFKPDQYPAAVQVPGGGLINPGLVAAFFTHQLPLATVAAMLDNEVQAAGCNENITFTLAPPPAPAPTAPASMVGAYIPGGAQPMFYFGPGVVPGVQGGMTASSYEGSTPQNPQPANVWDGMLYSCPLGTLRATVIYNGFLRYYEGFWLLMPATS